MRLVINLLLVALIAALIYLLINSINEPIKFRTEKDKREGAVASKLTDIRLSQEMYREIYGEYAPDFKTLASGLKKGQFRYVRVLGGDLDDPTKSAEDFVYDTTYTPAIDSLISLELDVDNLAVVPYTDGKKFNMKADTLTYQKTLTHVLEVGIRRKEFMGPYADPSYAKYDDRYDPNSTIKFGSLNGPNLGGNWE